MAQRTVSEELLREFCNTNGIDLSLIVPDGQESVKHPDYNMICSGNRVIVEVKELDQSPNEQALRERQARTRRTGTVNLLSDDGSGLPSLRLDSRIRTKIKKAMPQLRSLAKGKFPAVLVLYNYQNLLQVTGLEIRLAMYGNDIVEIEIPKDSTSQLIVSHRSGKGQQVRPDMNTTLSAIGLLTRSGDESLSLALYHNRHAAILLNPALLRSDVITHYRLSQSVHAGGLPEWEVF